MAKVVGWTLIGIVGIFVWFGGALWPGLYVTYPPAEPTTLEHVRACGCEGRMRVRASTSACAEVFEEALRQQLSQGIAQASTGSDRSGGACVAQFAALDADGRRPGSRPGRRRYRQALITVCPRRRWSTGWSAPGTAAHRPSEAARAEPGRHGRATDGDRALRRSGRVVGAPVAPVRGGGLSARWEAGSFPGVEGGVAAWPRQVGGCRVVRTGASNVRVVRGVRAVALRGGGVALRASAAQGDLLGLRSGAGEARPGRAVVGEGVASRID